MHFKAHHSFPLLCLVIYGLLLVCRTPQVAASIAPGDYLTQIILQFLIFLIPTIIYCRLKGPGYTAKLNFRMVGPSAIGILLLSLLLMISGSWLIRMAQLTAVMGDTSISFTGAYPIEVGDLTSGLYVSIAFAAIPAICEEFVFRSVLFSEYTKEGFGGITVGLMSTLLFAMMHFDLAQFPVYLWCGALLTLITYATQSVFPAILCHFGYNMYGIFGEAYLLQLLSRPQNTIFLLFILAAIFLLLLILLLGEAERIFSVYGSCDRPTPAYVGERLKQFPKLSSRVFHSLSALGSPFFILCLALFFMLTVVSA